MSWDVVCPLQFSGRVCLELECFLPYMFGRIPQRSPVGLQFSLLEGFNYTQVVEKLRLTWCHGEASAVTYCLHRAATPGIEDVELDFKIKSTIMNTNKIGAHSSEDLVWGLRLGVGNVLANAGDGLPTGKPGKTPCCYSQSLVGCVQRGPFSYFSFSYVQL